MLGGQFAIIDGFLATDVARAVTRDTMRGTREGWLRPLGTALNASGLDLEAYAAALAPAERCAMLRKAEARLGFKFQFHILDPRGKATPKAQEFPGHLRVLGGLSGESWRRVLLALLFGSAAAVAASSAEFDPPYFREFVAGDYALLHNDLGGSNRRALCMNYWFASEGWSDDWGGAFLWCGPRGDPSGARDAAARAVLENPQAARVPPAFNQASLFIPQPDSWHAVDVVAAHKVPSERRFSFTSWLEVPLGPEGQRALRTAEL